MEQKRQQDKEAAFEITPEELCDGVENQYTWLDIRGDIAYNHGHIPGAISWKGTPEQIEALPKDKKLAVYCVYGEKSRQTAEELREKGFSACHLAGGYRSWLRHSFQALTPRELERYDRQIILPQIGSEGQKKLKEARVLLVGAGGLGSPAALYLAGAGVGTIGILDGDTVSLSNLQRQILHNTAGENRNKAQSAREALERLNDQIQVQAYPYYLTKDNAEALIGSYDFVVDAVDNFETKFLINDTCVALGKPFSHGGILRFAGQAMTYVPGKGPCYRCIFEDVPEEADGESCSQAGVLGALAGIIGSLQALEALKYITGAGELLTGKMFVLDGLTMKSRLAPFPNPNPHCRACGKAN